MATSNRAAIINKIHKVLKKHYKPITEQTDRSLLENLLYACCLQNASYEKADEAFAAIQRPFFDWNEVRVTTVSELAEVIGELPDPLEAASNIKRTLQSVFESTYSFDLEDLKKQNIGKTVKQLSSFPGITRFATAYITQHSLGGHSIPIDKATLDVTYIVGAIDETERDKAVVPGLDRAVPKKKGIEFASLIHQVSAELYSSPFQPNVRTILLEIAPDAQPRFPKRATRKVSKPKARSEQKSAKAKAKGPQAGSQKAASQKKSTASQKPARPVKKKAHAPTAKKTTAKKK